MNCRGGAGAAMGSWISWASNAFFRNPPTPGPCSAFSEPGRPFSPPGIPRLVARCRAPQLSSLLTFAGGQTLEVRSEGTFLEDIARGPGPGVAWRTAPGAPTDARAAITRPRCGARCFAGFNSGGALPGGRNPRASRGTPCPPILGGASAEKADGGGPV